MATTRHQRPTTQKPFSIQLTGQSTRHNGDGCRGKSTVIGKKGVVLGILEEKVCVTDKGGFRRSVRGPTKGKGVSDDKVRDGGSTGIQLRVLNSVR